MGRWLSASLLCVRKLVHPTLFCGKEGFFRGLLLLLLLYSSRCCRCYCFLTSISVSDKDDAVCCCLFVSHSSAAQGWSPGDVFTMLLLVFRRTSKCDPNDFYLMSLPRQIRAFSVFAFRPPCFRVFFIFAQNKRSPAPEECGQVNWLDKEATHTPKRFWQNNYVVLWMQSVCLLY